MLIREGRILQNFCWMPDAHTNFRYLALLKVILPGNSQGKPGKTQSRVRSYGVAKEVALAITVSFFLTSLALHAWTPCKLLIVRFPLSLNQFICLLKDYCQSKRHIDPSTPYFNNKTGAYRGIHYFPTALNVDKLCVIVRT